MHLYRRLLLAATLLALLVIGLGAYVRLSDAGLGCPDWPGCYGHWLGVPDSRHEQLAANAAFPQQPVDTGKAWKEMLHRYCAGTLGLLILAISAQAWRREVRRQYSPVLPMLLFGIVGLQAALGMWTVSLLLKPLIVTLHLLGGMTTLALLSWLMARQRPVLAVRPNTERPITVTHGTNRLVTPAMVPEAVRAIVAGPPAPTPSAPPLWDGHAGERIAIVVERRLAERDVPTS